MRIMKIIFCTGNKNKFEEAKKIFEEYNVPAKLVRKNVKLCEIQSESLKEISRVKAISAFEKLHKPLFVEDAGLFIKVLNDFPGVYSSYVFKTIGCKGLLKLLRNERDRSAYFKAVVTFTDGKILKSFSGICKGSIAKNEKGNAGFGFDPIFIPAGYKQTFAENPELKNKLSHRKMAAEKLAKFLNNCFKQVK